MNTNYKETAVDLYEHGWNGGWSISVLRVSLKSFTKLNVATAIISVRTLFKR